MVGDIQFIEFTVHASHKRVRRGKNVTVIFKMAIVIVQATSVPVQANVRAHILLFCNFTILHHVC